jgi:hypothetical protein
MAGTWLSRAQQPHPKQGEIGTDRLPLIPESFLMFGATDSFDAYEDIFLFPERGSDL